MASLVLILGGSPLIAASASFDLYPNFFNACTMSFFAAVVDTAGFGGAVAVLGIMFAGCMLLVLGNEAVGAFIVVLL